MKKFGLLALLVVASMASAAIVEDFEGAYAGNGTVQADPDNASNNVLFLAGGEVASFVPGGTAGIITMDIYDFGQTSITYGPRWGVAGGGTSLGATIINKSFLAIDAGYGYSTETSQTGSWWSPMYFGGPRQVDALEVADDPETPEDETQAADGAWTTWTFIVGADGTTEIQAFGVSQVSSIDSLESIWFSGGKTEAIGVLVDNVTFTVPEPATMGLLGFGALALIRRRK